MQIQLSNPLQEQAPFRLRYRNVIFFFFLEIFLGKGEIDLLKKGKKLPRQKETLYRTTFWT